MSLTLVFSIINAVTVVALAVITWQYARSAKRQADAAESQAKAATKQAEVAEHQLAIFQARIQEQSGLGLGKLKENVTELKQSASHWFVRMQEWGQLPHLNNVELLPAEWSFSLEYGRRISDEVYQQLLILQRSSREASMLIDQFTGRENLYRVPAQAEEIKLLLTGILQGCEAVSARITSLRP
jgi:hypothetical protein